MSAISSANKSPPIKPAIDELGAAKLAVELAFRIGKQAEGVLNFIITNENISGLNTDTKTSFNSRLIILIGNNEILFHTTLQKTAKVYKEVNILIQKENELKKIELPELYKNTILQLLTTGRPRENYACINFFLDSLGLKCVSERKWEKEEIVEKHVKSGDGIILYDHKGLPVHFAFHLEDGITLSLGGTKGPFAAASLEDIMKAYNSPYAHKITPVANKKKQCCMSVCTIINWIMRNTLGLCLNS